MHVEASQLLHVWGKRGRVSVAVNDGCINVSKLMLQTGKHNMGCFCSTENCVSGCGDKMMMIQH